MIYIKNRLNRKISLNILFIGIFIIFTFMCNNRYLGITTYYFFPIISIIFTISYFLKKPISIKLEHLCGVFLIYYIVIASLRNSMKPESGIILSYAIFILLFLFTTLKGANGNEIRFLVNTYIVSAIIMSLNIIILRNEFDGWVGTYRYTLKFNNNIYVDPNFMAAFLIIPAIFSFNRIINNSKKNSIAINIIIFLLIASGIFLTGSRSALVALLISNIFLLIYYRNIKILCICLVSAFIVSIMLVKFLPNGTIERMFFDSYIDSSNITRMHNWIHGIQAFADKPLIGYGCVNTTTILISIFKYSHAIHNTYIAFLAQFGIIGCIPITIILLKPIIYSFKKGYRVLIPINVALVFTSTMIEQNSSIAFWITIIIIYIIIDYKIKNPNKKIEDII